VRAAGATRWKTSLTDTAHERLFIMEPAASDEANKGSFQETMTLYVQTLGHCRPALRTPQLINQLVCTVGAKTPCV